MKLEELEVKSDRRGDLVEAFKLPSDGQIFYVNAAAGETRGNHYHLRKTEHFLVVNGEAKMQVRDRNTNRVMEIQVSGSSPMVVTVVPDHTHNIMSHTGCMFVVWCDDQFD